MMDGFDAPNNSPMTARNGLSLLQQVRGRYLSIHYDVPALLSSYVRLLDQLGVMSADMKTCKLQTRMLYEGHSALYHLLKKMHIDSSETRAAEMRFAGGLELAWHAIKPLHEVTQEYVALDEMESWFQHSAISDQLAEMWKLLDATFIEFREELRCPVEPFIALNDTLARVLVVPGQADVGQRQVHRADQLELPKLFKHLVAELDSGTSLLFMKSIYVEEFMEAMQKEMNKHPAKSQTYKLYDERLQQLYLRSRVMPPVNEFDTNDLRRTSENPISESPPGSVFRGRTTSGDIVSIKMLSAFSSTEKARETLYAEVQRWNRLRHPHVQRVLGIWYPYSSRDGIFALVSKGIKRGDIMAYIKNHPTYDRVQALLEIGLGIQYLHAQGVPHGDLRGLNVLIKENGEPCLTNFGLMHALEVGCDVHTAMALLELGSVRWMAPEIYDAELIGKERGSPSAEADCHSFGMLILEIISGQKPFSYIAQDPVVVIELVRGGRPMRPIASQNSRRDSTFQVIDDSLWHLCESCWAFPPEKRLMVGEIVDTVRAHIQAARLEESRSRVGGNLLTLPGPAGHYESHLSPPKENRTIGRAGPTTSPLLIQDRALSADPSPTSPARPSPPPPPAVEYVAQSVSSTIHTPHSRPTSKPPLITPLSPPASSRGSRRSALPNEIVPGVTEEQESENDNDDERDHDDVALTAAQEMLAEAQEAIDFERRVLDEAESRLHDLQDALHDVEEGPHPDEGEADDRDNVVLHEVADNTAASVRDGGSVKQHTPPTQDDPVRPPTVQSPMPQSAGSKGAHSANDHRIESVRSASSPSITSGNAARPVHPPSRVGPNKASSRAIPRNTPRASAVESSGQSSSSVAVQQQSDYKRPRSTSQHSMSPSQASGPSRTVPRNSKHPDLARASQVPLLDSSSFIEPCDPSMVGVNRLSTILDVTDGEEAHALLDQPQRHAEDDPHWLNGQQGGDWEFFVQENRRQRNVGKGDGTFVLVSRPGTDKGGRGPAEPPTVSSGPPKRFPPAPGIIVRTPGSLARSKDLPSLPSPSIEGSQRWGVMDVGNGVAVAPDNEYVLASPKPGHSKGKSSDSVVTAIHFSQLRSPYMRPLPSSSIGLHTSSTATSQSVPQSALRVSKRSSAISARGSIPKPEQLIQIVSRGHGSAGARNQQFAGNKTTSTLSTAQQDELIGIGNAVCPRCGRQFSTKAVLDQHILKQGGRCHQRSLQQDLAFVGADLEE